jgi:hypothetical protein
MANAAHLWVPIIAAPIADWTAWLFGGDAGSDGAGGCGPGKCGHSGAAGLFERSGDDGCAVEDQHVGDEAGDLTVFGPAEPGRVGAVAPSAGEADHIGP